MSSEGFLGEVVDHLPEALVVVQDDGTIIYANRQFSAITGLAPDVLLGGDAVTLFGGDDPLSSAANWPEDIGSLLGAPAPGRRLSVASADDGYIPVDAYGQGFTSRLAGACHVGLIRKAQGELGTGTGTAATGHAATLTATGHAAASLTATGHAASGHIGSPPAPGPAVVELLDALDEGILMCDANGTVLIANRAARTLQGLPPAEQLVGRPYPRATRLLTPDDTPLAGAEYPLEQALQGTVVTGEPFVLDAEGDERRHILASARPVTVEDGGRGALLVLRDATPQVQSEAWLTHLAMHDALTGLANRHLLIEHVRRMLGQTGNRGSSVSLVYMDLDGFKEINDTYGHEVGDGVLVAVAQRLKAVVRPSDVVARLGGDEFVVAHASSAPTDSIEALVSRIRKTLAAPFQVHPHVLAVGASVGYVSTSSEEDPLSLLVRADREMFRRKKAARSASRPGCHGDDDIPVRHRAGIHAPRPGHGRRVGVGAGARARRAPGSEALGRRPAGRCRPGSSPVDARRGARAVPVAAGPGRDRPDQAGLRRGPHHPGGRREQSVRTGGRVPPGAAPVDLRGLWFAH